MIRFFAIATLILCLSSCGGESLYEGSQIVSNPWLPNSYIDFDWEVSDTTTAYDMELKVAHEEAFGYENLYTKLITVFPDGTTTSDVVSLNLRLPNGESYGNCSSTSCKVPFLLQDNIYFKQLGSHKLRIAQYSRIDSLSGVKELTLHIVKTNAKK